MNCLSHHICLFVFLFATSLRDTGTIYQPRLVEDLSYRSIIPGYRPHDLVADLTNNNHLLITINVDRTLSGGGVFVCNKITRKCSSMVYGVYNSYVKSIGNQPDGEVINTGPDYYKTPKSRIYTTLNQWTTSTVNSWNPTGSHSVSGSAFYRVRVFRAAYNIP